MKISGYAAVFGNIDSGNDIILPEAFNKTIADRPPQTLPLLWNHNGNALPIGRIVNVTPDSRGLKFNAELFPEQWAKAAGIAKDYLERGGIGSSIGFITRESETRADGVRVIKRADLFEISLTPIPMNPLAQVSQAKSGNVEYLECAAMTTGVAAIVAALAA